MAFTIGNIITLPLKNVELLNNVLVGMQAKGVV